MIKILFLFSIVWMFQGFNYRPFLPSIAKNKMTPSDTAKSSRSRLLNARWTHVLSLTLKTCICLSINFFKFFFYVWPSSISSIVPAWVSIIEWFCKGESLGNGKSTERFVKKIDKNSILLFIWSFSTTYHTCLNWNFTFCVTVQTKSGKLLSGAWKKG